MQRRSTSNFPASASHDSTRTNKGREFSTLACLACPISLRSGIMPDCVDARRRSNMSVLRLKSELLPAFRVCRACRAWSCLVEGLPPTCNLRSYNLPNPNFGTHPCTPRLWYGMKIFAASFRPFLAEIKNAAGMAGQFQFAFLGVLSVRRGEENHVGRVHVGRV